MKCADDPNTSVGSPATVRSAFAATHGNEDDAGSTGSRATDCTTGERERRLSGDTRASEVCHKYGSYNDPLEFIKLVPNAAARRLVLLLS